MLRHKRRGSFKKRNRIQDNKTGSDLWFFLIDYPERKEVSKAFINPYFLSVTKRSDIFGALLALK